MRSGRILGHVRHHIYLSAMHKHDSHVARSGERFKPIRWLKSTNRRSLHT